MKRLFLLLLCIMPCWLCAQVIKDGGLYYIVSAGNGPGYNDGPYNYENKFALYNNEGVVKWRPFDQKGDQIYKLIASGDDWYIYNVADSTYIERGAGSYNCNVTAGANPAYLQEVHSYDGKYYIKCKESSYVYSLVGSHNGPRDKEEGNLNVWGSIDEATQYGINLWYLVSAEEPGIQCTDNTRLIISTDKEHIQKKLSAFTWSANGIDSTNISWTTDNPDIATVDNGTVTAKGEGTANVIASAMIDGTEYKDTCKVSVLDLSGYQAVIVDTPGTLPELISAEEKYNIKSLAIFGDINNQDLTFLTDMAGRNDSDGKLENIYMRFANLVSYGGAVDSTIDSFGGCMSLKSIVVPESVIHVNSYAFSRCLNLMTIELSNVSTIESNAFYNCSKLSTVNTPKVKSIGKEAFSGCKTLTTIDLTHVETIGNNAFSSCHSLITADMPNVTTIGKTAFSWCTGLTTVNMPTINIIKDEAFKSCTSLATVKMNNITTIGKKSFNDCTSLATANMPNVATIGEYAFNGCTSLKKVTLSSTIKSLSQGLFSGCTELETVEIPENSELTSIAPEVFYNCKLNKLFIPKDISVLNDSLNFCETLTEIKVHAENKIFSVIDKILYNIQDSTLVFVPKTFEGEYTTPDFLSVIPSGAFKNCVGLTSVTLSDNIKTIEQSAFEGCTNLTTIDMANVKNIGTWIFDGCTKLYAINCHNSEPPSCTYGSFGTLIKQQTYVFVPRGSLEAYKETDWKGFKMLTECPAEPKILLSQHSVTLFDTNFDEINSTDITPLVMTSKGMYKGLVTWSTNNSAVAEVNDGHITSIGAGNAEIIASATIEGQTYTDSCSISVIKFPEDQKVVYIKTPGTLPELISAEEKYNITNLALVGDLNGTDIKFLREMAGNDYSGYNTDGKLENLNMQFANIVSGGGAYFRNSDNTTTDSVIGDYMFYHCTSLKYIVLPESVTEIGDQAFGDCTGLTNIETANVVKIGFLAFLNCTALTKADMDSVTDIEGSAFNGCTSLATANMPNIKTIGSYAFSGCTALTKADMNSVTAIGSYAFEGCTSLTTANMPNVNTVEREAFRGCTALTKADMDSVTDIEEQAFYSCKSLATANMPNVKTIGRSAFSGCTALTKADMDSVTDIEEQAFYSCKSLATANMPNVKTIGNSAFSGCTSLTKADMDSVTAIGSYAFEGCTSLTTAEMDSVTAIRGHAFEGCTSLTTASMHNVKTIESYAFNGCNSIATAEMDSVTAIGERAFEGCENLTTANMPNVKTIGRSAFSGCTALTKADMDSVTDIEEQAFYSCKSLATANMPNVKTIGNSAFSGCTSLTKADMDSVTDIEEWAFNGCTSLATANMPNVVTIEEKAFWGCKSLASDLTLNKVRSIGQGAFGVESSTNNIEYIRIPQTEVPTLASSDAIPEGQCTIIVPASALEAYRSAENWKEHWRNIIPDDAQTEMTVEVKAEDCGSGLQTAVGEGALPYITNLTLKGSINSYDFMLFRNKMPNLHRIDLTETTIEANPYEFYTGSYTEENRFPRNAFKDLEKIFDVKLPNSIRYIGQNAFEGCWSMRNVTMYQGITTIDRYAFEGCRSLKEINIPKGVQGINAGAFAYCSNLKNVVIEAGLKMINNAVSYYYNDRWYDGGVFQSCTSLETVTLPSSLEEIGSYTFANCRSLKDINLPPRLTSIQANSFKGCSSLESVKIPSYVTSIKEQAFASCYALKELRIPPMTETIADGAFNGCRSLKDIYVYIANAKDIKINQNTFDCWSQATLHVPDFASASYYWNTQWSQFAKLTEFNDTYDAFYTKNDLLLDESTGVIPGDPDATLYEKSGLVVNDNEKQDINNIELNHDGTDGASVIPEKNGNIKAEKATITIKVKANKWHFFCFPFNIDLDSVRYDGEYVWRQYDGVARSRREGGWKNLAEGTTQLQKGRGYIFQGTKDGDLTLTVAKPEFTADDVAMKLNVYTSDNAQDASWNFVGNPYVSYYNIDQTTYSAPITVWTGNGYEAYRPGDDDYEFSPYQAFFVQTPEYEDNVGFNADARETYTESQQTLAKAKAWRATQFVKPERLLINIELTAEGDTVYTDKTRVVFNNKASEVYETACDAAKFMSADRKAEIYSTDEHGVQYAINERPVGNGKVNMTLVANKAGKYTIGAGRMDCPVMLTDNERGIQHDLSLGVYEFTADRGTYANRFTLTLNEDLTDIKTIIDKTGINVTLNGGVTINNINNDVRTSLISLDGKTIGTLKGEGSINAPAGIYVLKIGAMSTKVKL